MAENKEYRFTEAELVAAIEQMACGYRRCNVPMDIVLRNKAVVQDFFSTQMERYLKEAKQDGAEPGNKG